MAAMTQAGQSESGLITLLVLWTLGILSLLGAQVMSSSRTAIRSAEVVYREAEAIAATRGAVQETMFRMVMDTRLTQFETRVGMVRVSVLLENDVGKINPNLADRPLLAALGRVLGLDPGLAAELATEIIDWRSDTDLSVQGGRKASRYAPLLPPGRLFHSLDELAALPAMTGDLLARMRPHLSLYVDHPPRAEMASPVTAAALTLAEMDTSASDEQSFASTARVLSVHTTAIGPTSFRYPGTAVVRLGSGEKVPRLMAWGDR